MLIKVIKVKEQLNSFYNYKILLVINSLDLFRIDLDSVYINHKFKILYISNIKLIFPDISL